MRPRIPRRLICSFAQCRKRPTFAPTRAFGSPGAAGSVEDSDDFSCPHPIVIAQNIMGTRDIAPR